MSEETLDFLEKVLSGLKARFNAGDKSVEPKLRATAAKIDQLKLQSDLIRPQSPTNVLETIKHQLTKALKRKSCCR